MNSSGRETMPTPEDIIALETIVSDSNYFDSLEMANLSSTRLTELVDNPQLKLVIEVRGRLTVARLTFQHTKGIKMASVFKRIIWAQRQGDLARAEECIEDLKTLYTIQTCLAIRELERELSNLTAATLKEVG